MQILTEYMHVSVWFYFSCWKGVILLFRVFTGAIHIRIYLHEDYGQWSVLVWVNSDCWFAKRCTVYSLPTCAGCQITGNQNRPFGDRHMHVYTYHSRVWNCWLRLSATTVGGRSCSLAAYSHVVTSVSMTLDKSLQGNTLPDLEGKEDRRKAEGVKALLGPIERNGSENTTGQSSGRDLLAQCQENTANNEAYLLVWEAHTHTSCVCT